MRSSTLNSAQRLRLTLLATALVAACAGTPPRPAPVSAPVAAPPPPAATAAASAPASPAAPGAAPAPAPRSQVIAEARVDFERAVGFMRTGNDTEAELAFKQVALQYPQFAAPLVD